MVSKSSTVNEEGPVLEHFAARLVEERKRLGLTQLQLREETKVGRSTQVKYESGETSPDVRYLTVLSGLGFDLMYMFTGSRSVAALQPELQNLVEAYSDAPEILRRAVFGVLVSPYTQDLDRVRSEPCWYKSEIRPGKDDTGQIFGVEDKS